MKLQRFIARGALAFDPNSLGVEFALGEEQPPPPFVERGAFAVVDIFGPLSQRDYGFGIGWDSYEAIASRVDAALESACPQLLLRVNSPGGEVAGCFELADEIRAKAAAKGKRVVAYVDGMAASAGYALACAAERIVVPPTGIVGSIGCIRLAVDQTGLDRAVGVTFAVVASGARKADGNPHIPISKETLAAIQAEVDAMAAVFFAHVSRARGLPVETIAALEAATFVGAAGAATGLADEVLTLDALLSGGSAVATITARTGAEESMDEEKEKAIAALKALAASDDEDESKAAKAALKAMGVDEGEKGKAEGDGEKPDAKAEGGDDEAPESEEKPDAKAAAAHAAGSSLALAATVQSLSAKLAAREQKEEREKLLASRPDFTPEVRAFLERQPVRVVRDAVKTFPKGKVSPAAKSPVEAARAAIGAAPTVGQTQGEGGSALSESEAHALDVQMGLAKPATAIRNEGTRLVLGVMTPAQARAELAKKGEVSR